MCTIMLDYLQIKDVKLITNNPFKIKSLTDLGINVVERIPLKVGLNIFNKDYLETKQKSMSHLYDNSDF